MKFLITVLFAVCASLFAIAAPLDYVMDFKGENVFRKRPFFPVLELKTRDRIRLGLLKEEIPESLIRTRTCFTLGLTHRMTQRSRDFIVSNYLRVGQVNVSGRMFRSSADGNADFELFIPVSYALVSREGVASGELDGTPYLGPRFLEAGHHHFVSEEKNHRFAIIWSRAIEKGCTPFDPPRFWSFESEF